MSPYTLFWLEYLSRQNTTHWFEDVCKISYPLCRFLCRTSEDAHLGSAFLGLGFASTTVKTRPGKVGQPTEGLSNINLIDKRFLPFHIPSQLDMATCNLSNHEPRATMNDSRRM